MCLGVPGKLEELFEEDGLPMGRVRFGGVTRKVCLSLLPHAEREDFLVVHVGFALARIDADEAAKSSARAAPTASGSRAVRRRPLRHVDEYRDAATVQRLVEAIARTTTRRWTLLDVCGGHEPNPADSGLATLLSPSVRLVRGPSCPVCATPPEIIDRAAAIAARSEVIFCSYGDMLRVRGTRGDLWQARAEGADVRVVYSPLDALRIARENPRFEVVFLASGFETTAAANAQAVELAQRLNIQNFSLLTAQCRAVPAIEARVSAGGVDGVLGAGHVCTVTGTDAYGVLSRRHRVPVVISGFEPVDVLESVLGLVQRLERGEIEVDIQYTRAVETGGNALARELLQRVFEVCDRGWRGQEDLRDGGYRLKDAHRSRDAVRHLEVLRIPGLRRAPRVRDLEIAS
jgi:hydrogenase expression/formation protein HypD